MDARVRDPAPSSTLQIRADARDARVASEWMATLAAHHRVPQDQINRLDICLNEALANVISYGNDTALAQPVVLQMQVNCTGSGCEASLMVSDAGLPFDMAHAPLADRPHSLQEAEPGGLGLLMIRSFSDALDYQRRGDRNELTFSVRWNPQPDTVQ